MNNIKLNAKLKVLIIVFYTLILFGVLLLTLGKSNFERFSEYSSTPYDDNLAITVREMENRKSKYYTGDKKELGEHEKSTFDLQVTLVKLQTKALINNIRLYVAAKTVDNGYRYKEYSSSTKSMSEYTYTSVTSFSTFATKEYATITKDGESQNYLFDEEPTEFYVKVTYTIGEDETVHTLTYKTEVAKIKEDKLSSAELRSIIASNATSNPSYVDPKNDPVRVKFTKELAEEASKLGSVKEDSLKVQFNVLKENLNSFKLDDEKLKANKLVGIEIPKDANADDAWDVFPEIKEIKFEVYAKIKSTDKDFSEYVKVYSIYGFLSKYRDLSIATAKFDESFDVEEIYVVVEGKLHNATQDTFSSLYTCKYNEVADVE